MNYVPPTSEGWTSQVFGTRPGGFNPAGGHTGEDIAVPVGTPLVAMAEGVVVHVGYFTGSYTDNPWWIEPSFAGYVVTVDYGPYISHYAHCSGSPVLSGKRVRQGDVVAYSGNTGTATSGPHCHWEIMPDGWDFNNGTYGRINPRSITGAGVAAQGTITPQASQEDELSAEFERDVRAQLESDAWKFAALDRDLRAQLDGLPALDRDLRADLSAKGQQITALTATLEALAGIVGREQGLDVEQIKQAVTEAIAAGIKITVTVPGV